MRWLYQKQTCTCHHRIWLVLKKLLKKESSFVEGLQENASTYNQKLTESFQCVKKWRTMTDKLPNALACQFSTLLINQIFPQKSSRLPLQIWNILSSKWHNAQVRRELLRHGCYNCYSWTVNILISDLL